MEKRIYKVAEIEETRKEAEELLSCSLDDEIKERMKAVIEAEAPIRKALLYKRVLNSFGLQKVGSRLLSLFEELSLTLSFPTTLDGDGEVVLTERRYSITERKRISSVLPLPQPYATPTRFLTRKGLHASSTFLRQEISPA